MKAALKSKSPQALPADYTPLCREVWLPQPIHDEAEHAAALEAIEPLWGRETGMTPGQADWFGLIADLISAYEERTVRPPKPLPPSQRLAALINAQGMTAADLGRLLGLTPGMGSKLISGARRLTASHIRQLSARFALPAEFFL